MIKVVRLHRLCGESRIKAFADIVINDSFLIKGLQVIEGAKGLFVAMPKEKIADNQWYDAVRPLTKEARNEVTQAVLEAYKE